MSEQEPATEGRPRTKAARQEYIAQAVRRHGFVNVDDLAETLDVSRMTVHRDLDELQAAGVLRKVRGGASAHRSTQYESDLQFRLTALVGEKRRIARVAAELAADGDVVIVDDSTTALEVVPLLADRSSMTVITNFVPAIEAIKQHPHLSLIGLGGQYVPRYSAFLGMLCERALEDVYADVLFASTSSLRGSVLYHQDQRVVTTKRAMIASARRRVLLLDHTKVGQGALYRLCDVAAFTHVVVDDGVDATVRKELEEQGLTVLVA